MIQFKRDPLTAAEVDALKLACSHPADVFTVGLLLETGLRISEFCELRSNQIDFQISRLTVWGKGGNGHNGNRRIIPLSPEAEQLLRNYHFLIVRQGDQKEWISARTVERRLHSAASRAFLMKNVVPHVLRHTFAVRCVRRGISIRVLMELLGHKNIETTMLYLKLAPEDVCEVFKNKW